MPDKKLKTAADAIEYGKQRAVKLFAEGTQGRMPITKERFATMLIEQLATLLAEAWAEGYLHGNADADWPEGS